MITDEELMNKIDQASKEFSGDILDLYQAVGMIVVGRFFGWEVMRLATPRKTWTFATKLFGDPKLLMRPREKYSRKSIGLNISDKADEYWAYVKGHMHMPLTSRRGLQS